MQALATRRLALEPLVEAHADALFEVLKDPGLYRYLDTSPPSSVQQLRRAYARLEARVSPDGGECWLNWVIREPGGEAIGYVQATVVSTRTAWVAYVLSSRHWGRGYASEATQRVIEQLATEFGVTRYLATVEAENRRSIRLLERLGFHEAAGLELEGRTLAASERLFVLRT